MSDIPPLIATDDGPRDGWFIPARDFYRNDGEYYDDDDMVAAPIDPQPVPVYRAEGRIRPVTMPPQSWTNTVVRDGLEAANRFYPPQTDGPEDGNVRVLTPSVTDPAYLSALKRAFPFMRSAASKRYSANTLMALLNASDRASNGRTNNLPLLVVVESPVSFDPDTETKTGGMQGMLATWAGSDSGQTKTVIGVAEPFRRKGVGTGLVRAAMGYVEGMTFWVAAANREGQSFLLSVGLIPVAMNGAGSVCYGFHYDEDE